MVEFLSDPIPPSKDIKHFTNRDKELTLFRDVVNKAALPLPVLMFYGVGGAGKSWLLQRLRNDLGSAVPSAWLDFDLNTGGDVYHNDSAAALGQLRRQFQDVECVRFDLAFHWLWHKQGYGNEPAFRGGGALGTVWEAMREAGAAVASDVPASNIASWLADKLAGKTWDRLKSTATVEWLLTKVGQDDYRRLSRMTPQEIYPELSRRLLLDLKERLPTNRHKRACRGVIFLDGFEALKLGVRGQAQVHYRERWVRNLFAPDSPLLLVLCGRDRLQWEQPDPDFSNPEYLSQHLVGGLSAPDAHRFLEKCGVDERGLQDAILRVCPDEDRDADELGYHPFSLGLCADTVIANKSRSIETSPSTFNLAPGDKRELALRFLRSLGDPTHETWVKLLALTPRFDEEAARSAFSHTRSIKQDTAWKELRDYSFVSQAAEPGWLTIHTQMRDAVRSIDAANNKEGHHRWQEIWQSRIVADLDEFAALRWYHQWCVEPRKALNDWDELAENCRRTLKMSDHMSLLKWWAPTALEATIITQTAPSPEVASALNSLGIEYGRATLGDRSENLRLAIDCYNAALRVYNEDDFPQKWAATQNNLGIAYGFLPSGDRGENLRLAIDCFNAALRVRTEDDFPQDWAGTQNNLGNACLKLPSGDRGENLRLAIDCYDAALRVYTEDDFPQEWAGPQNNLGIAYGFLPSGDRGENLRLAIDCFNAALRVRTEDDFPQDWAGTHYNLGIAYRGLPSGDRGENLRLAIDCYDAALRVYTEDDFPQDWAETQNNLGNAYFDLPRGDRGANLRLAIDCYNAALRVYTEQDFPQEWARTHYNLGIAYRGLPSGDRGDNLRLAIECYNAALRVYTEDDFPKEWAGTQNNLGIATAAYKEWESEGE